MRFQLTRERKLILGAGAVLLLAGLVYNLLPVFEAASPGEDLLAVRQQQIATYRERVKAQGRLEGRLEAARRRLQKAEAGLLQAKTPALAAVDIQQVITQIATRTEAEVKTMRILGSESLAGADYIAIPVEVTVASDIRQLVGMLYEIENAPKLLRTKDLAVRSAGVRQGDKILSTFTVEGFMKKETTG